MIVPLSGGIAFWCVLATLHVLSGKLLDTPGLFAVILLALVAALAGRPRIVLIALTPFTLLVLIVATTPLSSFVARHWERVDPLPDSGVAAVVVLSSGLNPDTTISGDALDRLVSGLELVESSRAPLLVTTQVHVLFPTGFVSSDVDQSRILTLMQRPLPWLRANGGNSTHDEAMSVSGLLRPRGIRRIAVVTSPLHTRRACATFEAVGFVVTCRPARMRDPSALPLAPGPENRLAAFGQWIYEVAAVAEYAARGWLACCWEPPERRRT